MTYHELPHDIGAEKAILGSCLLSRDAVVRIGATLTAADFYAERHGQIYAALLGLHEQRVPIDMRTVSAELKRRGQLDGIGGFGYLTDLIGSTYSTAHVEYYAADVARLSRLRKLIAAGAKITALGYGETDDESAVASSLELLGAITSSRVQTLLMPLAEVLDDIYDEFGSEADPAIPTGLRDYDELTGGGLWPGELVVPAGRSGHGKSSYVGTITANVAASGRRVLFFGLEMQRREVGRRLLASKSGVDSMTIRRRKMDDAQMRDIADAIGTMRAWPIMLADARISVAELRTAVLRDAAEHGAPALIVVDYIQLIKTHERRGGNRTQEIGEVTRELKALAQEARCTVMAPSQLNREIEHRKGANEGMPQLSDLRESGDIENDADAVDFIVRPAEFNMTTFTIGGAEYPTENLGVLIRRKGRNTGSGAIPLFFDAPRTRFCDMTRFRAVEGYE